MFRVTLLDLGNLADLDAHKRRKEPHPDEVFVSVTEDEVKFEPPKKATEPTDFS